MDKGIKTMNYWNYETLAKKKPKTNEQKKKKKGERKSLAF